MLLEENTAKPEVFVRMAERLQTECPEIFNLSHFLQNYNNVQSREAFRKDLQELKSRQVQRFLVKERMLICTGYHPYEVLYDTFEYILAETGKNK